MNRRKFILGSAAAASVVATGSYVYFFHVDSYDKVDLHPFIQEFLSDKELSNIKKEYLAMNSNEKGLETVKTEEIRNIIKQDFNSQKVSVVNGWVLSETELEYLATK